MTRITRLSKSSQRQAPHNNLIFIIPYTVPVEVIFKSNKSCFMLSILDYLVNSHIKCIPSNTKYCTGIHIYHREIEEGQRKWILDNVGMPSLVLDSTLPAEATGPSLIGEPPWMSMMSSPTESSLPGGWY